MMRMYGMSYAIMGKTIIVGTPDSIGRTTGKESTRQYRIAYADMKAVEGLVQGLAGVKVVIDERLRTLYVTGRPEQFLEVEKVLQQVDHPGRQVLLQARIIEVTDSGKEELETIIDAVYNQWWFNYSSAGAGAGYVYADQPANYNPKTGDNRPAPLAPITGDGLKNIAQGNLTIRVTETPQVSQPAPFSTTGTTTTVPRTDIQVDEDKNKRLAIVNEGVSLQELVDGLNALGVGPRDMIGILQAIKAAGALHAEIEVM
jgi:hypothetical protein